MTAIPAKPSLPPLPHWETAPPDLKAAVREVKAALRARLGSSGRSVDDVFAVIEARVRDQVEEIASAKERGETVWPVLDYADIAAGSVAEDDLGKLARRGCLVVRGHFEREQALAWDASIVDYVQSNGFFEAYKGPGDDFFSSVGSKPEIYPIYWSPCTGAGAPKRADGHCPAVSTACGATRPKAPVGSTPTEVCFTPTASAAAPKARAPMVWAPTWTPAPSTCG